MAGRHILAVFVSTVHSTHSFYVDPLGNEYRIYFYIPSAHLIICSGRMRLVGRLLAVLSFAASSGISFLSLVILSIYWLFLVGLRVHSLALNEVTGNVHIAVCFLFPYFFQWVWCISKVKFLFTKALVKVCQTCKIRNIHCLAGPQSPFSIESVCDIRSCPLRLSFSF